MSPCLVQQLFRQKIGKELDQGLIDEVLFPMLRSRKEYPRELLLDIKLTQSSNEYGWSAISRPTVPLSSYGDLPAGGGPKNISPFTYQYSPDGKVRFNNFLQAKSKEGKLASKYRRILHPKNWGTIDILNQLRGLKHPQLEYHSPEETEDPWDVLPASERERLYFSGDEFEDAYIRLEERPLWPRGGPTASFSLVFVNDYLEDALNTNKRLSWGGNPENMFEPILSTIY